MPKAKQHRSKAVKPSKKHSHKTTSKVKQQGGGAGASEDSDSLFDFLESHEIQNLASIPIKTNL